MAAVRFEQVQRFILAKKYFGVRGTLEASYVEGNEELRILFFRLYQINCALVVRPTFCHRMVSHG